MSAMLFNLLTQPFVNSDLKRPKLAVSVCNLIPWSLRPQSIMGTPLFSGDAFQWARFRNVIPHRWKRKFYNNSTQSTTKFVFLLKGQIQKTHF